MSLTLTQSATAVGPNIFAGFQAQGGTPAYVYSIVAGGAGGIINSSTGAYTAPSAASSDPAHAYDTILVTDSTLATATAKILVGTPLILFCDIIQTYMGLSAGRTYLWDQKIFQPTDSGIYIAVSVPSCKPFGNVNEADGSGSGIVAKQFVAMQARVTVDIISRGPDARDRKEEVILALNSDYARYQQDANSFYISQLSNSFINLSQLDGAAIPYRYQISLQMIYTFSKATSVPYDNTFSGVTTYTNP